MFVLYSEQSRFLHDGGHKFYDDNDHGADHNNCNDDDITTTNIDNNNNNNDYDNDNDVNAKDNDYEDVYCVINATPFDTRRS